MDDEQRLNELAGRILDGRGMDWKAEASPGADADAALLAELKVLADIVELHRRGQGDTAQRDGDAAVGGPGPASTRHRASVTSKRVPDPASRSALNPISIPPMDSSTTTA